MDQWVCEICDKPEDQCCCDDYLPEEIETYYPLPPTTSGQVDQGDYDYAEESYDPSICSYFLEGNCRYGDSCRDYHPTYPHFQQQEVCQYFLNGNCRYGETCRVSHVVSTETPQDKHARLRALAEEIKELTTQLKQKESQYNALKKELGV